MSGTEKRLSCINVPEMGSRQFIRLSLPMFKTAAEFLLGINRDVRLSAWQLKCPGIAFKAQTFPAWARRHANSPACSTLAAINGATTSAMRTRGPAHTIHAGWRKLRESAASQAIRMPRKRRQPPDPARPASLEPATSDRRRLGGEKVTKQSQNSKDGSHYIE